MENQLLRCLVFYTDLLVEIDEAKFERGRCLANMNNAERCYSVIAAGIRRINNEQNN